MRCGEVVDAKFIGPQYYGDEFPQFNTDSHPGNQWCADCNATTVNRIPCSECADYKLRSDFTEAELAKGRNRACHECAPVPAGQRDGDLLFVNKLSCAHCQAKEKKLFMCTGCSRTYYCSRECQKAAWGKHKAQCKIQAKIVRRFVQEGRANLLGNTPHARTLDPSGKEAKKTVKTTAPKQKKDAVTKKKKKKDDDKKK